MYFKNLLNEAKNNFSNKEYKKALFIYSLVLEKNPLFKEAKIGAILTEMAMSGEEVAHAIFEYYSVLKLMNVKKAENIIEDIISSLDNTVEDIEDFLDANIRDTISLENGILYEDFKEGVRLRGDFKRTFEDIMFCTKVIITKKEDFIDFLENLIEYNFKDMAINYLESAVFAFPTDPKLRVLFNKIGQNFNIEDKSKK